jgi:hypothetical protein
MRVFSLCVPDAVQRERERSGAWLSALRSDFDKRNAMSRAISRSDDRLSARLFRDLATGDYDGMLNRCALVSGLWLIGVEGSQAFKRPGDLSKPSRRCP